MFFIPVLDDCHLSCFPVLNRGTLREELGDTEVESDADSEALESQRFVLSDSAPLILLSVNTNSLLISLRTSA